MKKKENIQHMIFQEDKIYNDPEVPLYKRGEVVEVEERMVARWLKRGGILVDSHGVDDKKFNWKKHLNPHPKKTKEDLMLEEMEKLADTEFPPEPVTVEPMTSQDLKEEVVEEKEEPKEHKHHGHKHHNNKHK